MPQIIDYEQVFSSMQALGLNSLYYNSGAFGPADRATSKALGWIGSEDPTIRPEARTLAKVIPPPIELNLSTLTLSAWKSILPGPIWFMPKSHWAYELDFGNRTWLPDALEKAGFDWNLLAPRTNASALQFELDETESAARLLEAILMHLSGSDFAIAWPKWPVACTIHHHKQIWWMTGDAGLYGQLNALHL